MIVPIYTRTGVLVQSLVTNAFDVETGHPMISEKELECADFSYGVFRKIDFELCFLDDSVWSGCALDDVKFFGDIMMGANFSSARLCNVEFYGVTGLKISFKQSKLASVKFLGSCFKEADFSDAHFEDVTFSIDNIGGTTSIEGAIFAGATFKNVLFEHVLYDANTSFPEGFCAKNVQGLALVT